jgi:hypothetical protein
MGSPPSYTYPARALEGTLFTKQSAEKFFLGVDFTEAIADGDSLASCVVSAIDLTDGSDASAIVLDAATNVVIANSEGVMAIGEEMVMAGTNNKNYKITFTGVTASAQTWECDITMRIRDT